MQLTQTKYQAEFDDPGEPHEWQTDAQARKPKAPTNFGVGPDGQRGGRLNRLPPGSDIAAQNLSQAGAKVPCTMSGETDVSKDWNRGAVAKGYTRLPASHGVAVDVDFGAYDDVVADGQHGFCERRNIKDRL